MIAARQETIRSRGLNAWPEDGENDLTHIRAIHVALQALSDTLVMTHPIYDLRLSVRADFNPRMAYYFALGDYEQADLQLISEYVVAGDRVMECGGGAGITGSFAGIQSGNPVTVVEPNDRLYEQIRRTFEANGQEVEIIEAAVVPDDFGRDELTFGIHDEYWWSSALAPERGDHVLQKKAIGLAVLLENLYPTVLILDIEGGEVGLFPTALPECLRAIMIEIHTPDIGDMATAEIVNHITSLGFLVKRILAQTWLFTR